VEGSARREKQSFHSNEGSEFKAAENKPSNSQERVPDQEIKRSKPQLQKKIPAT
jgi:hypothetical protein